MDMYCDKSSDRWMHTSNKNENKNKTKTKTKNVDAGRTLGNNGNMNQPARAMIPNLAVQVWDETLCMPVSVVETRVDQKLGASSRDCPTRERQYATRSQGCRALDEGRVPWFELVCRAEGPQIGTGRSNGTRKGFEQEFWIVFLYFILFFAARRGAVALAGREPYLVRE